MKQQVGPRTEREMKEGEKKDERNEGRNAGSNE